MTMTLIIRHADEERVRDCAIRFEGIPPRDADHLILRELYDTEGAELAGLLFATLPGGTVDALIYHLLKLSASLYRVTYKPQEVTK